MDWHAYMANITDNSRALEKAMPGTAPAYRAMSAKAHEGEALDKKMKELIALSIAAATHCDPCIGYHAKMLAKMGATREEVTEAMGMVISMQGGPGYMYAGKALEAFDQFSA